MASGTIPRSREPGRLIAGRLLVALPLIAGILAYIVSPRSMAWSAYAAPEWLRWLGVALGVASMLSARWVLRAIGSNVSETILTKSAHQLVTHGPYRWVRHPFYDLVLLRGLSSSLLTANWLMALLGLSAFATWARGGA